MKRNISPLLLIIVFVISCTHEAEVSDKGKNLYWGDLHNHNEVGYAKGSLSRSYDIAKSHLDFYCFTPHSQWHDQPANATSMQRFKEAYTRVNRDWDSLKRMANKFYAPGKFVTFIGYEWHSSTFGDSHIIFPGNDGDLVYPGNIKELQDFAGANNAILIPHHPAYMKEYRGQNWEHIGNKDITPVVEIFSEHGNAESDRAPSPYIRHSMGGRYTQNTIQYLWSLGKQVGVVASSDDHLGYPGGYGEGMVAVYADTLTRESIMEAIKARRTYGINADRIELDFRLNGHYMGESIPFTERRDITVNVKGKDVIDRVEVLRNNEVIYRYFPVDNENSDKSWEKPVLCRIEYGWGPWSGLNVPRTIDWDFDISVKNGRILSATPCFQSGPLDEDRRNIITGVDDSRCSFISYTGRIEAFEERPTNSVILEILGSPDTELNVSLDKPSSLNHQISLEQLTKSNDIFFTGDMTSESVMIHRVVFDENYSAGFKMNDKSRKTGGDWYYVRVIQANGSLAWSSPIWINNKE